VFILLPFLSTVNRLRKIFYYSYINTLDYIENIFKIYLKVLESKLIKPANATPLKLCTVFTRLLMPGVTCGQKTNLPSPMFHQYLCLYGRWKQTSPQTEMSNIYAVVQKMIKISSKQSGIAFYRTVIVIYFLLGHKHADQRADGLYGIFGDFPSPSLNL